MRGYTYHRLFPTDYEQQPAHWFLYDAAALTATARNRQVPLYMVDNVRTDLRNHNYLYHAYERFATYEPGQTQAHMELSLADPGRGDEIAALYHLGSAPTPSPRSLYVQRSRDVDGPKGLRIPILHPLYEPLQYPLLFPAGTRGWGLDMHEQGWTQRKYYKSRLLTEKRFQDFSRLGCEYICDMFSRMEDERLDFVRRGKAAQMEHLQSLRHSHNLHTNVDPTTGNNVEADYNNEEDDDDDDDNKEYITLPASFTGSPKYFAERTADALALSRQRGKPDLMVTATTNP
ncbi:hypothetical protein DL93DRAFT_2092057, partial [Clavulina sp. PMI_390]